MKRTINVWKTVDWLTIFLYLILIFLGWINIYAAVYSEEHRSIVDFEMRYGKQLIWITAALIIALIILTIDIRVYIFFAYPVYFVAIISLILVLFFGKEVNSARSWFEIGDIRIQPTEFAKVATSLAIAKYLSSYNIKIEKTNTWLSLAFFIGIPITLISLQPDTGSILTFAAFSIVFYREGFPGIFLLFGFLLIFLSLLALIATPLTVLITIIVLALLSLFILRTNFTEIFTALGIIIASYFIVKYIINILNKSIDVYYIMLIAVCITGVFGIIYLVYKKVKYLFLLILLTFTAISFTYSIDYVFDNFLQPHQQQRINILLGKESDPRGAEYNVNQSKIAIGSGGFWGKGFLQGTQTKFNFVPEQSTDFIFCTVGEEWGFVGSFVVISLFAFLILRILFLSERQRSTFSRIYGYGVASIMFIHVAINIGMTIGLLPVIGIPLPFFSYGGSSLWAFTILLFIFLRFDASRMEMFR